MKRIYKSIGLVAGILLSFSLHVYAQEEGAKTEKESGGETFTNGLDMKMIWVAPGSVKGTEHAWTNVSYLNRGVKDIVIQDGYYLAATEVTQKQWDELMEKNPSKFKGDDLPVERVSWDDAMEYCKRLTEKEHRARRLPRGYHYTLPTEHQWEYACRAGSSNDRDGNLEEQGWVQSNSDRKTHPVGTKAPNPWGFYDMYGNVWEWCENKIDSYDYLGNRGGSWASKPEDCRAGTRGWESAHVKMPTLGFRVALVKRK
jgi:formylglycine-generating enzyme required for sulfatase activity